MGTNARASITEVDHDGFTAVVYSNDVLRVTVLPEVGAKVVSLVDLRSGRQWLTAPTRPLRRLKDLDDEWHEYDRSGWDECFPSVSGGYYPIQPWAGTPVRDMGELWQRPWQYKENNGVLTSVHGLRFPYEFSRHLHLDGPTLEVTYTVRNLSEVPFLGVWSMHPLFAAVPGMKVWFPSGTTMTVDSAVDDDARARYRQRLTWPSLPGDGDSRDLSVMRPPSDGGALKLFTERGQAGRSALCDPKSGAWLGLQVDPGTVPHFGLWLNEGRWPSSQGGLYHVALEPTNGCTDSLDVAAALGSGLYVPGQNAREWTLSMVFGTVAGDAPAFVDGSRG
jgi:galactose mutarotase-like enzyme